MKFSTKKTIITLALITTLAVLFNPQPANSQNKPDPSSYSFVYLGDLHFDKNAHHDFDWVKANMPNDIRQIEGYVKNSEQHTPALFQSIQQSIDSSNGQIQLIVQAGDLTEGLCGNQQLQQKQFEDTRRLIRKHIPDTTFLAVKGNHDITGPGAKQAYDNYMLKWLSQESGKKIDSASFFIMQGPDLFVFFDAYKDNSLDWLQTTLNSNSHRYAFVVMHPPAVPYTARSTWHLFSKPREKTHRKKFLEILGANKVILLTAHLHKYVLLERKTEKGTFTQLSVNSVVTSNNITVKDHLQGLDNYNSQLTELEPQFQPETITQRKQLLEEEKPQITRFEYAQFPGYAVINVSEKKITMDTYKADSNKIWKTTKIR